MEKPQLDPQITESMALPITPQKARESDTVTLEKEKIPDIVFQTVNRLITSRMSGEGVATVLQRDIVTALVESGLNKEEIFAKEWLAIGGYYRGLGWRVEYDRPGWNEDYPAYFKFEAPAVIRYHRLGSIANQLYGTQTSRDEDGREIVRPIGPMEAVRSIEDNVPDVVFDTVNRLIQENIKNKIAIVMQEDIVKALVESGLDREEIFKKRWLNIEDIYSAMGWIVMYDAGTNNWKKDDYRPHYFEFHTR